MTYQVLARKWRPKQFKELVGQDHIVKSLKNSIANQTVAHAYLLTGTRGVGKTTVARIFAKALRCLNLSDKVEPCLECTACKGIENTSSLDYVEIDGASNTGVENIRELIENVQYLPTTGSKKVYVIDEVHMLSVSAFNALLKTLEEPPEHVVFIFATTDPQKLLGTVLSRCFRLDFRHLDTATLSSHLRDIASKENIQFENDQVVESLARLGNGSVRDSLSLLDQAISFASGETITQNSLLSSLGMAGEESLRKLMKHLFSRDKTALVQSFNAITQENIDIKKFATQLLEKLFIVISSVNKKGEVDQEHFLDSSLEELTLSELLWMYEVLVKDFEWGFKTANPEKSILFSLIKVSLRDEVLGIHSSRLKAVEIQEKKTQKLVPEKKDWNGFVKFLFNKDLTLASNLEHGNIVGDLDISGETSSLEVGFGENDRIFFDFLNTAESKEKIKAWANEYWEGETTIGLQFTLMGNEEDFQSMAQLDAQAAQKQRELRIDAIRTNKYIQEAQDLFGSKIEKIILNE